MEKKIQHKELRGLPGGPNEMPVDIKRVFSTEGYRIDSPDVDNDKNIIPSGSITMKEKDGSPLRKGPIHGVDNLGNEQVMYPGYDYEFPGTEVTETLIAKMGGGLLDKTIKCGNCGWEWKAADGGSDIYDCHKCPGKGVVKAQTGKEVKENTSWTAYLNPANWGTSRYDDAGTFKEAFRAARNEGDSDFLWKGDRYSTELKAESKEPAKAKGITPELLIRQAYRESAFNPNTVSPKGYKGLGQIGDGVIKDYKKANNITGNIDPFNMKQNSDVQKYSMNELYNSSFINKPGQSENVRLAKTLASYNWGRGNVMNLLNDLKEEGVDIYNSLDWVSKLPEEPRNYINDILLQKNTTFNTDFSKALGNQKNKPIKSLYGFKDGGESKPGPLMQAYNRLPAEKKMGGAIDYKQGGGEKKYSEQDGRLVVTTKKVDTADGPRFYQAKSPDYNFSIELIDAKKVGDSIPRANLNPRIIEALNKKEFGGQLNSGNITMYKDYIKGNIGDEIEAVKNYDKLNRIYYSKAKELGMTVANYIMTHVVGNS